MNDDQHEENDRAILEGKLLMEEFARRMENGLCFVCGEKVSAVEQVGRCIYAKPCGHRQGQGKVK
jgi:hypothetical protein